MEKKVEHIKPGDRVRLKGESFGMDGRPNTMIVESESAAGFVCVWRDNNGVPRRETYPATVLVLAKL